MGVTVADWDTNGTLDVEELKGLHYVLKGLGKEHFPHPLTPSFAEKAVAAVLDTDGDGLISRSEWINFVINESHAHGEAPMLKLMQTLATLLQHTPKF